METSKNSSERFNNAEEICPDFSAPEDAHLERTRVMRESVSWSWRVTDVPVCHQMSLTARVLVLEGEAQLFINCYRIDGTEISGSHSWRDSRLTAKTDWNDLIFNFLVPPDTHTIEVIVTIPESGHIWFTDCKLCLVLDNDKCLRDAMVAMLTHQGAIPNASCQRALLLVPRHYFLPKSTLAEAYLDEAIITHRMKEGGPVISSSSQPSVMALMLGQLRLRPGLRVLEIGTGTGYNAALLAELVGQKNVISVELDKTIASEARANLDAAGYEKVSVVSADGWLGCPKYAPYDRIIITVGVHDLSPAWIEQLEEGGILVAPLSFQCVQYTIAFRKRGQWLVSEQISPCGFMDMRGEHSRIMYHNHKDGLLAIHDTLDDERLNILNEVLDCPAKRATTLKLHELGTDFYNFLYFLSLAHPMTFQISDPRLGTYGIDGLPYAIADMENRQIAVFNTGVDKLPVCFGGPEIGMLLKHLMYEWIAKGKPGLKRLRMSAFPYTTSSLINLSSSLNSSVVKKEFAWFKWKYRKSNQ